MTREENTKTATDNSDSNPIEAYDREIKKIGGNRTDIRQRVSLQSRQRVPCTRPAEIP